MSGKSVLGPRSSAWPDDPAPARPELPPGTRIYVVGDIHGRSDLLAALHRKILLDARDAPARCVLVYLGDFIDRGGDSPGVVDLLLAGPPPGFAAVHLKGNHEQSLLDFLEDTSGGPHWLSFGGDMTLSAYGIALPAAERIEALHLKAAQSALRERLPAAHRAFFSGLVTSHAEGDYFFAHAGIRPGVALAAQTPDDLMWIREPFLSSTADHGKVVVHGHSISDQVEVRANRIGIDTGAYFSGRLSALVLEGATRRILST